MSHTRNFSCVLGFFTNRYTVLLAHHSATAPSVLFKTDTHKFLSINHLSPSITSTYINVSIPIIPALNPVPTKKWQLCLTKQIFFQQPFSLLPITTLSGNIPQAKRSRLLGFNLRAICPEFQAFYVDNVSSVGWVSELWKTAFTIATSPSCTFNAGSKDSHSQREWLKLFCLITYLFLSCTDGYMYRYLWDVKRVC